MSKYPLLKILKEIHQGIDAINNYPWYVLSTPFYSKMNDFEDSSFEYITKLKNKNYQPPNNNNIYLSIIKNLLCGSRDFIKIFKNSKIIFENQRKIKSDIFIVDYYFNKKSSKTILEPLQKKFNNAEVWIVDSNKNYDKNLDNYTVYELFKYCYLLLISIFYLPIKKIGLPNFILESTRIFNSFYAFKFYLAGKDVKKFNVNNIHLLYEDQLRDRLLIRDSKNRNIFGYIHSSLIHQWRLNKIYSPSDIYLPNNIICIDHNSLLSNKKFKFKNNNVNLFIDQDCFSKDNLKKEDYSQQILRAKNIYKNICIYLPNSENLSAELIEIAKKLNILFFKTNIFVFPHPNQKYCLNSFDSRQYTPNNSLDIIISSYRTNKGYEFSKKGFQVIYFGSSLYSSYNPTENLNYPIIFTKNFSELKKILKKFLNRSDLKFYS